MEHLEIAQKRIVEEMVEMSTADDALEHGWKEGRCHSGTCDEHGGASAVPQAPSANDVDSAGGTEDRRRAETAATEQNPAGTDNSADGVGKR